MAFSDFLSILKESLTVILFPKNGKLMAFIAISSIVLYSVLFLLFNCSIQTLISDLTSIIISPDSAGHMEQLKDITALLIADEIIFGLLVSVLSLFFGIATITVSAASYTQTTLSLKDLLSLIRKTCKRTLVAALYVVGLAYGYFSCLLIFVLPLLILYPNLMALSFAAVFGIAGYVLYVYLYVTWGLAIVVSVVEEDGYGVNALGRASALVKGKKAQGFMLIFCFILVLSIATMVFAMVFGTTGMVYGVLTASFSALVKIWGLAAYTVLYFHCKKHHGEEMEHGSVQYAKLSTALLVNDMA